MSDKHSPTETEQLTQVTTAQIDGNPFSELKFIGKGDVRRGALNRFDLGDDGGTNIPARARIVDAYFRLTPDTDSGAANATNISIALLAKDGKWDPLNGLPGGFSVQADASDMIVTVNGTTGTWSTGVTTDLLVKDLNFGISAPVEAGGLGQCMQETGGDDITDLDTVDVTCRKAGTPTGDVLVDVYEWTAGGLIDEDQGRLATSDPVDISTIADLFHAETFTFTGGDVISWNDDDRRAFVIRTDGVAVSTSNFLSVQYGTNSQYAPGGVVVSGARIAFAGAVYPDLGDYPKLYEVDDETIDTPPFGSIVSVDFPPFVVVAQVGTPVEVHPPDMHLLIQEWVNSPGYEEGDPLAVMFVPHADSSIGIQGRNWNDASLIVEFRPRNIYNV